MSDPREGACKRIIIAVVRRSLMNGATSFPGIFPCCCFVFIWLLVHPRCKNPHTTQQPPAVSFPLSSVALIGLVQELVKEGLIKGIGLSEISAADIRKAHAVHPITAVEMEWSLFSRDAEVCIGV